MIPALATVFICLVRFGCDEQRLRQTRVSRRGFRPVYHLLTQITLSITDFRQRQTLSPRRFQLSSSQEARFRDHFRKLLAIVGVIRLGKRTPPSLAKVVIKFFTRRE